MFKKTTLILSTFMLTKLAFSQDVKKEVQKAETKMDAFASKTGTIVKFVDTKLPDLKLSFGSLAETRIRKIISGGEARFYYQIVSQGKYSNSTASIDYSDLLEVIKAIKSLNADVEKDIAFNPDYLENKFTTTDGFQVGYYVSKGKASWYLRLEKYGSDNTIFVKDSDGIETAFTDAKIKIEELKK
ncbi:MAG: hypothetical protein WCP74_13405 [Sphingobacteriia bacterium]